MSKNGQTPISRTIYAVDVGSTRAGNFGWAKIRADGQLEGGSCIHKLSTEIANDLKANCSVALGLEAPLTIPVPADASKLSSGRSGEGNRSFAAPAGLTVTALGLHQAAWLLAEVKHQLGEHAKKVAFAHEASAWPPTALTLFCWEAFVSGEAHSKHHVQDAATAARAFASVERALHRIDEGHAERPLSVIGAAALWSYWATDPAVLHAQSVVIKPSGKQPLHEFASIPVACVAKRSSRASTNALAQAPATEVTQA